MSALTMLCEALFVLALVLLSLPIAVFVLEIGLALVGGRDRSVSAGAFARVSSTTTVPAATRVPMRSMRVRMHPMPGRTPRPPTASRSTDAWIRAPMRSAAVPGRAEPRGPIAAPEPAAARE